VLYRNNYTGGKMPGLVTKFHQFTPEKKFRLRWKPAILVAASENSSTAMLALHNFSKSRNHQHVRNPILHFTRQTMPQQLYHFIFLHLQHGVSQHRSSFSRRGHWLHQPCSAAHSGLGRCSQYHNVGFAGFKSLCRWGMFRIF
jgi:hypothetical protein